MISRLDQTGLTERERRALEQFSDLVRRVERVKGEPDPPVLTLSRLDHLIAELHDLQHANPTLHRQALARLREGLDGPASPES
ncbi:MAG: hypothetical protein ACRD0K_10570 [Egibacteraceae bacterium]